MIWKRSNKDYLGRLKIGLIFLLLPGFCGCADNRPVSGAYPREGLASWYHSRKTSSGESFKSGGLTCAMRLKNFGRCYRVCNKGNGKCVIVRHNDFGPAKRLYKKGRIVDLTKFAFSQIAHPDEGLVSVTLEEVRCP
jgi:rare lipoprotein A